MTLDIFTKLDELKDEDLHPKAKLLMDEIFTFHGERQVLSSWTDGFEDRDNKIVKEFQTTFHSSLWEFYLYKVFKEANFEIDFSKDRPDFIVKKPYPINIEAVVAEIKKGGPSETNRGLDDILKNLEPLHLDPNFSEIIDEAITRHSNSINAKMKKYTGFKDKKEKLKAGYRELEWVEESTPFVIALGSYDQISYGREFHYSLIPLLYGYYYNLETNGYFKRTEITKPGTDSKLLLNLFEQPGMEELSAVIFSCSVTFGKLTALVKSSGLQLIDMNHVFNIRHDFDFPHYKVQEVSASNPEELSDGLFIFHNPNAKNKLPLEAFEGTNAIQITVEGGGLKFEGENCPIVARLNISKVLLPDAYKSFVFNEVLRKFNPDLSDSFFQVEEIDSVEIILRNMNGIQCFVDIDETQFEELNSKNIEKGSCVMAELIMNEPYIRLQSISKID